jgi:hypothetical protein
MAKYAKITRGTAVDFATGGYKNVALFCPKADFLALQAPDPAATALGDQVTIDTAHTFTSPKGFISHATKTHTVTGKAGTVGEDGASELEWTYVFVILGDNASTQEQMQNQLNDELIYLFKDADCLENQYVQLGNDCVSPTVSVEFDGKTTKEGKKEYTVTVKCKKRYFYTATVTEAT